MLAFTGESIMRASGNTRVPLAIDVCTVALNAILAPLLIYGLGPFPRLGLAGAAWATVFSQLVAVACYVRIVLRRHPAFPFARRADGPPVRVSRLARIGAPTASVGISFSVVYVVFSRSAARFGAASLAIVGIANRIEAILFAMTLSIGIAAGALVGQNIGAGRPDRADATIRTGMRWGLGIAVVITVLMVTWPAAFISLFTRDAEAMRLGVPYLRILATCFMSTALEIVCAEAVLGSGHTRVLSLLYNGFSLLRIPLAFWVPDLLRDGALGIAWVITVTCNLRAIAIIVWAARGTWKRGLSRELHGTTTSEPGAGA
jgi:putative MATE family efflux protein